MKVLFDQIPHSFNIYEEGDLNGLKMKEIKDYLQEKTAIRISHCGNIYKNLSKDQVETIARKIAQLRIKEPWKGPLPKAVLEGEVGYEKERLKDPNWRHFGILYEGVLYQQLLRDSIFEGNLKEQNCTILFTNQLIGTWDSNDRRYHIRTSLYGFPHIISISGMVMAPAKPREFYLKRQMGVPVEFLKEEYKDRFIDYGDERVTEVIKGYVMQAFFYHLTGEPFCEDPDCRLFNSHWQEQMIHAQLDGAYEFCPRHEELLNNIRKRSQINKLSE